jgi:beta-phosphoglucomutase-like phosphatase (HAD superfamily)
LLAAQAAGMPVVAVERTGEVAGLEQATWRVATLDDLTLTPRGEVVVKGGPTSVPRQP